MCSSGGDKIKNNSDKEEAPQTPEWIEETPKEDHRVISRALENPLRRKIMKFIGLESEKTVDEISEKLGLDKSEAKNHLGFLENAEIVRRVSEDPPSFKLDEIGRKYLQNVENVE